MNALDYSMETITQEQEPIFQTPIIPDILIPKVVKKQPHVMVRVKL